MTDKIIHGSSDKSIDYIKILLAIIVALIAMVVRMPSAFLVAVSEEQEEALTDDSGLPYFTDPDSYYHIRLVDTMLKTGKIADTASPDGEPWDIHSFYPEGRTGAYQPGIVYLTIGLWKIFNLSVPLDISRVEFYLSGFMAMLTALAAFITGCRLNGKVTGFVAGILTSCAPDFVNRTSFGRFDTDIFVVLMNVLLILFLTEMLRTNKFKTQLAFASAFVLTAVVYANCWATQFSTLFVGLTIASGLICAVIDELRDSKGLRVKERLAAVLKSRAIAILIGAGVLILLIIGITLGFKVIGDVFSSLKFNVTQEVSDGVLPNMLESIAELERPALVPDTFTDWFKGYVLGAFPTVVTGIGGLFATIAALGGLVLLGLGSLGKLGIKQDGIPQKRESLIFITVLGLWTIAGLYLIRMGIRFIEILTIPTGLLAGIFAGYIPYFFTGRKMKWRITGTIVLIASVALIVLPDIEGVLASVRLPSVTDASAKAMEWIRENADDPEAPIETWWDMGYFYESESGHPCLWDGGSQDSIRAILISRAMVTDDMEMSCRILNMLACSGNEAVDLLMEHTDPRTAFDILWEVLPMDTEAACAIISDRCSIDLKDARKAEKLIHPRESKEAYLVLTYTMIKQTTMYEYYSDWDFTGTQISPYEPDDTLLTDDETKALENKRDGYTMWRLFFDVENNPYYKLKYEYTDGIEGVRVWRVTSI